MKYYFTWNGLLEPKNHYDEYFSITVKINNKNRNIVWKLYCLPDNIDEKMIPLFYDYNEHEKRSFYIPHWEFLKTKHTFIKKTTNEYNVELGINYFELSEDDLMYMKLMDWIK